MYNMCIQIDIIEKQGYIYPLESVNLTAGSTISNIVSIQV